MRGIVGGLGRELQRVTKARTYDERFDIVESVRSLADYIQHKIQLGWTVFEHYPAGIRVNHSAAIHNFAIFRLCPVVVIAKVLFQFRGYKPAVHDHAFGDRGRSYARFKVTSQCCQIASPDLESGRILEATLVVCQPESNQSRSRGAKVISSNICCEYATESAQPIAIASPMRAP